MAYEVPGFMIGTLVANVSLTSSQYLAVKVGSNGKVALSGAGQQAIGILQNKPGADQAAEVMGFGLSKAIYGNTVTAGQALMSDASGKLVPQTGTNAVVAVAITSGVLDDIATVFVAVGPGSGIASAYSVMSLPVNLASVANGDVLTTYTPGFAGQIVKASFAVTVPATTAAKTTTLTPKINATSTTGGVLVLTSANCTPLGKVTDATAITAANAFVSTDTISVVASSTTAFVEGAGALLLVLKSA